MRPARLSALRRLLPLLLLACQGTTDQDVLRIEVTPSRLDLDVGDSRALVARVVDASGAAVSRRVHWSSENPVIATVTAAGSVEGLTPGATRIAASSGGQATLIPVQVTAAPIALIRITPGTTVLEVGSTTTLRAEALRTDGSTAPVNATWRSEQPARVSISPTGEVTALAPGLATVTAMVGAVSGTAIVRVDPSPVASVTITPASLAVVAGQSSTLQVRVRTANGQTATDRPIVWSSTAPPIASVSSSGVVTGLTEGTATIVAASEGRADSARITVQRAPVATVRITPPTAMLAVGRTTTLDVQQYDAGGGLLAPRAVQWSTDAPQVAVVDDSGVVTAVAPGTARIAATVQGVTGAAMITVTAVPVARVSVSPATLSLTDGDSTRLQASAFDAAGSPLPGRPAQWVSGGPSVVTIDARGVAVAISPGTALVFATVEGVTGSATVTVKPAGPPPVASVAISPSGATLQTGNQVQLAVVPRDADGNALTGRQTTWRTIDGTLAAVTSTGLLTARAPGMARVVATVEGVADTAQFAIAAPPPPPSRASLRITPIAGTVHVGHRYARSVVATVRDSLGSIVSSPAIAWRSDTPGALMVGGSGATATLTAVGAPTANVRVIAVSASNPRLADTLLVTTDLVSIARLVVAPDTASGPPSRVVTAVAQPLDSAGTPVDTAQGNPLRDRLPQWRASQTTAAPSVARGLSTTVTLPASGTVQLVASLGALADTAVFTVRPSAPAVASITSLSGSSITLQAGQGRTSTERFLVADDRQRGVAAIPYRVLSSDSAKVTARASSTTTDANGRGSFVVALTTAAIKGTTARIEVEAGGKRASWTVTVR